MACTLSFTIGKFEFPSIENIDRKVLYGEGEDLSPKDLFKNIVKVLKKSKIDNDSAYNKLVLAIEDDLNKSVVDFSSHKIDDFTGVTSAVKNANMEYIRDLYPDIDFPLGIDTLIIILDLLEPNSAKPIIGRVLDEGGKELIILRNDRISMLRFSKFLQLKLALNDPNFLTKIPEQLLAELKELTAEFKMPSILDLGLQFDINQSLFYNSNFNTSTGRSAITVLTDLLIYASGHEPVNYKSKTLNELNRRLKYFLNGAYLDIDNFFSTILNKGEWGDIMRVLGVETGTALVKFLNRDNITILNELTNNRVKAQIKKLKDPEVLSFLENLKANLEDANITPLQGFFRSIMSLRQIQEHNLGYDVINFENRRKYTAIIFNKIFPTLEKSGIGMETLKNFVEVARYGSYRVYQRAEKDGSKVYYVSNHIISKNERERKYLTLEDAKSTAEKLMNDLTLLDASLEGLRNNFSDSDESESNTFKLDYLIPTGTIVEILPFKISKKGMLAEEALLFKRKFSDFLDYIDTLFGEAYVLKSDVLKALNSPEKAAIFLSELNNPDNKFNVINSETQEVNYIRNDYLRMADLALKIAGTAPRYYFIRSTLKTKEGNSYTELNKENKNVKSGYRHYYIPIEDNKPEEVRKNPRIPIIKSLESISNVLLEKFGVPVHIIDGLYINDLLNDKEGKFYKKDINLNAKAFIVDGEIYVNTDVASSKDLFHEYTHLFLGVLKAGNFKAYQQILDYVSLFSAFQKELDIKQKLYPNRSYYDLMEEVFADLYGEWIENNLPRDISRAFEHISNTDEVKATQYSVFDKTADGSNKGLQYLFGGKYLTTVWSRFNRSVAQMLSDKENLSFMRGKDLKLQRLLSNWIESQIRLYKEQKKANPNKADEDLEGIKEVCV